MEQRSKPLAKSKGMTSLIFSIFMKFFLGAAALGVLIFMLAWTLNYWQAWAFIAAFTLLLTLYNSYFSVKDPALMERRKLDAKEIKPYIWYSYVMEVGMLVLSPLDHRFGWSLMPGWVSIVGDMLVALAIIIWFFSKRENSYAGAALKIYEGHKTVTTGPYAVVRHPSYVGDLVLVLGIPLALGSWWGLILFALMIPAMVRMIHDEERLLKDGLPGYAKYTETVRYRLIPYIW